MKKLLLALFGLLAVQAFCAQKPNVVIVMTDDQGYGDLGINGNTLIQTPNIDRFGARSIRLENYHVDTTCAPSRSALMTGRYSNRVGVWHTVQGRNMIRRREITMADIFSQNGYSTGIFGKWHLGDVYPYRPEDNGFQYSVIHQAGGVGQAPDYWGNDYFDDTYSVNGKLKRFKGFCTDIWFNEGISFIERNAKAGKPFLVYITPNAPHGPFYCPEEYYNRYKDNPEVPNAGFYGMITHIDDNMARLFQTLDKCGITDDTILIFTTDNGTAGGIWGGKGFDAGMRGTKGSQYEGGHRVPFFLRWPGGGLNKGKSVKQLTAHFDILPTLIDLCGLDAPDIAFDGKSIRNLLYTDGSAWPERTLMVETQRVVDPVKWRKCSVMTERWRLVDGKELYDILKDPGQKTDIAEQYPEVVERLRGSYETWWADVSREHNLTSYMIIGSDKSPIVKLCSHDWLVEQIPWNQAQIMHGMYAKKAHWAVETEHAGIYEFSLRRWPVEADLPINEANGYKGFNFDTATIQIGDFRQSKPIPAGAKEITFRVELKKGLTTLAPYFSGGGEISTPYYVYVTHKPFKGWQTPEGMGIPRFDPDYGRVPPQPLAQDTDRYTGRH
ncbi:N-acetylgalactosamine-4-sulfatase [Verrucomicrobia bacterium S94]|nr:N-acetylgalactosamine-4-sulfatase [Verrucomicrobia bacterium S94]